jgi:hypothetical protein|tara:strand:- start:397 stop:816 length:420 start_codon:yes stop_codon:yes gene_type:complete
MRFIILLLFLGACSSDQLSRAPNWYIEPPTDKENIYASGYANDTNLQFAIEVSTLSAKRSLAGYISSTIDGKSKYYRGANGKNLSQIAAVDTIDKVSLSGYKRDKIEIEEEDGQYMVYVLLAYPLNNLSQEPEIFKEIN